METETKTGPGIHSIDILIALQPGVKSRTVVEALSLRLDPTTIIRDVGMAYIFATVTRTDYLELFKGEIRENAKGLWLSRYPRAPEGFEGLIDRITTDGLSYLPPHRRNDKLPGAYTLAEPAHP